MSNSGTYPAVASDAVQQGVLLAERFIPLIERIYITLVWAERAQEYTGVGG